MNDNKIKVTVEYNGEIHTYEGYTLMGSIMALPKDAPVQGVLDLSFGRLSVGDRLSAVVSAIVHAKKELEIYPKEIAEAMIRHAINEGSQKRAQ